jgi:hypothetical protein
MTDIENTNTNIVNNIDSNVMNDSNIVVNDHNSNIVNDHDSNVVNYYDSNIVNEENLNEQKMKILTELRNLECFGIRLTKRYDMNSSLEMLTHEYKLHQLIKTKRDEELMFEDFAFNLLCMYKLCYDILDQRLPSVDQRLPAVDQSLSAVDQSLPSVDQRLSSIEQTKNKNENI